MMFFTYFNTLEITVRDLLVVVDTNWLLSDLIGILLLCLSLSLLAERPLTLWKTK